MSAKIITENIVFDFGKHEGKSFIDVLKEDYGYLLFLNGKSNFEFSRNAEVMLNITQYMNRKTKNFLSSNFMREMLTAVYFSVEYSKRENLDSQGWIKLRKACSDIFETVDNTFEYDIPERLARRIIENENGELILGLAFLAMVENKAPIEIIPRIMNASDPEFIYKSLCATMDNGAKQVMMREQSIHRYTNWGIW